MSFRLTILFLWVILELFAQKVKSKEKNMTINLHDLTGQESGIILVETDDGRHMNMVANWGAKDGLPYLFEPMLEPF